MKQGLKLASRAMQAGMVGLAISGLLVREYTYIPAALIAVFISTLPSVIKRDLNLVLPVELNFWIVLALFVHIVGSFSGFYDNLPGWDHLTHAMSASLVAALGFVVVVAVDKYADSIYLPPAFLALFIIMFTMAIGVIWELTEYLVDELTCSHLQYSLTDTMRDLLFDTIGALLVASVGSFYLTHTSIDHFVDTLQVDKAKERVKEVLERRARRK
jgi:hypothetical protein